MAAQPDAFDPAHPPDFKPLDAYGLIGDTRTAALVGRDGSMDWLCLPAFDSPAVFAALLDPAAGRCCIQPTQSFHGWQRYETGTNILCTEFECATGRARLRDLMPIVHERRPHQSEIHREMECVSGEVELELTFEPAFDFGRARTEVQLTEHGAVARVPGSEGASLVLTTTVPLQRTPRGAAGRLKLKAGQDCWSVLGWQGSPKHPVAAYRCDQRLWRTRAYWHKWLATLRYEGDYRAAVERSMLAMKLLTFSQTGALIASPTASVPEWAGGGRNWDYRYSWVRDSSFMLRALFAVDYTDEGTGFLDWLLKRCTEDKLNLRVMYSVHGGLDVAEEELALRGWRDSKPVRIGNAAVEQFQLDIYGSLIDAALHYHDSGGVLTVAEAETLVQLVEQVARRWREPDQGIWESRGEPRHYTYSKVWAWVALVRGADLAQKLRLEARREAWLKDAKELQAELLEKAFHPRLKAFTQSYGSEVLDSSVLVMPITGIIAADDPRFGSTREAVVSRLTAGRYPLLYRYDHKQVDDGVGGPEGAFLLPSFWLVEGLAMAGRLQEARAAFSMLLSYASPLGLLSEQVDPRDGSLLGNFPQGFSHLGLINAALRLEAWQAG